MFTLILGSDFTTIKQDEKVPDSRLREGEFHVFNVWNEPTNRQQHEIDAATHAEALEKATALARAERMEIHILMRQS